MNKKLIVGLVLESLLSTASWCMVAMDSSSDDESSDEEMVPQQTNGWYKNKTPVIQERGEDGAWHKEGEITGRFIASRVNKKNLFKAAWC